MGSSLLLSLSTKCLPVVTSMGTCVLIMTLPQCILLAMRSSAQVLVWVCRILRAGRSFCYSVLFSLSVGICGSSCALSDAQNGELFAKMLIAQIFASALGIYGIIIGIIVSNFGQFPN